MMAAVDRVHKVSFMLSLVTWVVRMRQLMKFDTSGPIYSKDRFMTPLKRAKSDPSILAGVNFEKYDNSGIISRIIFIDPTRLDVNRTW